MAAAAAAKSRTVVEPFAQFDLAAHARSPVRSVAVSTLSDAQTLVYLGTESGALALLQVVASPDASPPSLGDDARALPPAAAPTRQAGGGSGSVSFLRSVAVTRESPVDSVHVLAEIGKVLVLSEGSLFLVDSLLTQPTKRIPPFRGISAVARRFRAGGATGGSDLSDYSINASDNPSAGSRLLQKFGSGIRANGVKVKEAEQSRQQPEGSYIFAIVIGKRLVIADFSAISESLVVLREMQCVEGVKAMVWLDDSIMVGTASEYILYSCITGQSGVIFSLPDGSSSPRLKLLRKEWKVLLLVDNVGVIVDSYGQPAGGSLVFRRGLESVAEVSSYVMVVKDGKMDVYHKKSGSCIQTPPFAGEGVGPCFVADEENANGNLVVVASPSKVFCYRKVPSEEQIKDLLRKKSFNEAISLVEELESEGEMSKDMLSFVHAQVGFLLLFDLHFEQAVNHFLQSEIMQPSEVFPFIMRDPNRWSLLVPRNRYWGLHPPPAPLEDVVDNGLAVIQRAIFLRKAGVETSVDHNFLLSPPNRADLLEAAIKSMIRYLEVSRKKDLTSSVKEGVDTLLMYLYRALNSVDKMEELASSENSCVVEELENLLDDSGHLRMLAFLYASKGMSSKALAIWRVLARNYTSSIRRDSASDNELQNRSSDTLNARETAAREASKILEESSDQNLVLQHFGWIADINQVLAVKVLTSETREKQLSPSEVLAAIDLKKVEIRQRYLQWLIEDQDSDDTHFHTMYAISLAKSALESYARESMYGEHGVGNIGEKSTYDSGSHSIFESPVRERLQIFLESSDLYDPMQVLELIEDSELWLEKAILYRKLGQETMVLQILALKLEDSEAAEQYCAEIGRPDAYMQLLDMYLDPHDGKEPMFKAAVRLLHNHGESLDPLQVLETLSPEMPLQLASDTILRMLRARLHHHRQGQIVHNLSRAVDLDARLAILEERSRHVQINDESLCDSCQARLGTKLFAMYPDDTVVCYKCFRRQGESTSVSGRDFRRDVLIKPGWLVTK
ncbi:hypothetical protein ACJRO7_020658 [Eucalyptus globulus]|uniref:CNH domain-containing protein n=1 Tax=Eucalyptus globulus TaxID=34317 RepID=A0ABD3KQ64_EUCGL